ncbi:dienelactone hydrolase family protein [Streptomyces collinus]|uniref:dienelactone hydrolase family protein n=1 Tax=Streptomyces collinus TaxID=42684 RepID=UPI0029435F48|nr:dienelactone hydrolase family protein [Streptomyces collinus]
MSDLHPDFLARIPSCAPRRHATQDGPLWTFTPKSPPRGAILFFYHRTALDAFTAHVIERLTGRGFAVAVPDLFHGMDPDLEPDEKKARLVDDRIIAGSADAVGVLRSPDYGGDRSAPAALGFCMGGRLAFLAAAGGTGVSRACCFYGGDLDRAWHGDLTPIERVSAGIPDIQLHRGVRDSHATEGQQHAAVRAIDAVAGNAEAVTYAGARHAFANPFAFERYHARATSQAWSSALRFLEETP